MKITMTLLMLLVLLLPNALAEEYTQMNLPEGAVARIGKGSVEEILYSPDGSRLAVQSSIGIWLYDTTTLSGGWSARWCIQAWITSVAFSPDGKMLASGSSGRVRCGCGTPMTGEPKGTLTGHTKLGITECSVQPGWQDAC